MLSLSSRTLARRCMAVTTTTSRHNNNNKHFLAAVPAGRRYMGEMPVPRSSQAKLWEGHPEREGWEFTIAWWYTTSFVLIVGVLGFAPETEIATWAKQEAMARLKLKEDGTVSEFEFGKHYQNEMADKNKEEWDKFSVKSVRMNEDDDDDEDDDDEDEDDE